MKLAAGAIAFVWFIDLARSIAGDMALLAAGAAGAAYIGTKVLWPALKKVRAGWRKADEAFDVLFSLDKRHTAMNDRHARNEEAIAEIRDRLKRGEDRFGRIEDVLSVMGDEERLLIERRLHAVVPERRSPPVERRDPSPE